MDILNAVDNAYIWPQKDARFCTWTWNTKYSHQMTIGIMNVSMATCLVRFDSLLLTVPENQRGQQKIAEPLNQALNSNP